MKRAGRPDVSERVSDYLADLSRILHGSPEEAEVLAAVRAHFEQRLGCDSTREDVDAAIAELGPPEAVAGTVERPAGLASQDRRAVRGAVGTAVIGAVLFVLLPPAGALISLLAVGVCVTLLIKRPQVRGSHWLGFATILAVLAVAASVYWFVFARGSSTEVVLHDPVPSQVP